MWTCWGGVRTGGPRTGETLLQIFKTKQNSVSIDKAFTL